MFTRFFYGYTVGDGADESHPFDFIVLDGVQHAWCTAGLYAVYFYIRIQMFDCKGDAGDKSPSAYRNDYGIQVGQLFQ